MPVYHYQAFDEDTLTRGVIEADSAKAARQQLRARQLLPVEVELADRQAKENHKTPPTANKSAATKVRLVELTLLTRQLASLVEAGFPLEEALRAVAEQSERESVRTLVLSLRNQVLEGRSFSQALANFSGVFPPIYVASVRAGENSGHLDLILEQLATYLERRNATRQKLQQALVYPFVVTTVCLAIVTFLLTYVVPKMVHVFSSMHETLPGVTVALLAISAFLKHRGIWLLLALVGAVLLGQRSLRVPAVRLWVDAWLLRLPLLGKLFARIDTGRYAQTLGMLIAAGVPLLEAMHIATGLIQNGVLKAALEQAQRQVKEGQSLHRALKQTGYFPAMSLHLVASGEASSRLAEMLGRAAQQQADDVNRLIDMSLTLFEPLMILVMGAVVLFIVLAVLLPIFSMDQLIRLS